MAKKIAVLILIASVASTALAVSVKMKEPKRSSKLDNAASQPQSKPKIIRKVRVLPDGFAMAGVDVTLSKSTARDVWVFTLNSPVTDEKVMIRAGIAMEAMPSSTLEKMIASMKDANSAEFRIWARVTQYDNRNFVFPLYYLAVHQAADINDVNSAAAVEPNIAPIITNEANDTIVIPEHVLEMLKPKRTVDLAQVSMPSAGTDEDAVFSDRTGFIKQDAMRKYVFVPDSLGRNVQKVSFTILPNDTLKRALVKADQEPGQIRYKVSGILTTFDGQYYILLQRALRQFSYGNLAR